MHSDMTEWFWLLQVMMQVYSQLCRISFITFRQKHSRTELVGLIENGSWAPTAAKTMRNILETMKNITIVEPVVTIKSVLKETDIPALDQLADALK